MPTDQQNQTTEQKHAAEHEQRHQREQEERSRQALSNQGAQDRGSGSATDPDTERRDA